MAKKKETGLTGSSDLVNEIVSHLNQDSKNAYSFEQREDPAEIKKWISTGSTLLDYAISNRRNGGIPYGRITEINGLESTGKSLLTFHMIANAQKQGALAFLMDTEGRMLDKEFLLRMGVDPKRLVISNPGTLEGCFEQVERTIEYVRRTQSKRECSVLIVWDSLAATPAQAEVEGTYDPQSMMGIGGKATSLGLKKLCRVVGIEEIAWVIVNQLRFNMKAGTPYMDPYVTPYGKAVPYYSSVRLRVQQKAKLKSPDGEVYGFDTDVKVLKNSLGPPARVASFPIIFGYGVDDVQSIYDYLKDKSLLRRVAGKTKLVKELGGHEFPHEEWKPWFAEHKDLILDCIEELMVKKYEDRNPENELHLVPEVEEKPKVKKPKADPDDEAQEA